MAILSLSTLALVALSLLNANGVGAFQTAIHKSVEAELEKAEGGTLLVTFRPAHYEAANDPQALLEESRKHLPFLVSVDVGTFAARDDLYQKYRGEYVYTALTEQHEQDREVLHRLGAEILEDFAVSNSFVVRADRRLVASLSQLETVVEIHTNNTFTVDDLAEDQGKLRSENDLPEAFLPERVDSQGHDDRNYQPNGLWANDREGLAHPTRVQGDPQWNVAKIGAPLVWAQLAARTGTNSPAQALSSFVYAVADTGVDFRHDNIAGQYRGLKPDGTYDHNYSWWDGVRKPVKPGSVNLQCEVAGRVPCDDQGHGTHVTSIAVGKDGFGVAPGARWIGCRNMDNGVGSSSTYLSCLNFFLAPHDLDGKNARPDLRPHAVGNSYGCPNSEGCTKNAMTSAFNALRAAGVFTAVSAGNEGPGCSTIDAPPAVEPSALVVGAVSRADILASFSSRGPVAVYPDPTMPGKPFRKPDVVAPGVDITAAYVGGGFRSLSGTSMAGPHVGGAGLLLMAACPCIERNIDVLRELFQDTALPKYPLPGSLCGNDTPDTIPNNHYGYGRIDVAKAMDRCLELCQNYAEPSPTKKNNTLEAKFDTNNTKKKRKHKKHRRSRHEKPQDSS